MRSLLTPAVGMGAGVTTAATAAKLVVAKIGFTKGGILAGSYAASMMSAMGGAATPAGGVVASLQAVGATGSLFAAAPVAIPVVAVGVGIGALGLYTFRSK